MIYNDIVLIISVLLVFLLLYTQPIVRWYIIRKRLKSVPYVLIRVSDNYLIKKYRGKTFKAYEIDVWSVDTKNYRANYYIPDSSILGRWAINKRYCTEQYKPMIGGEIV